MKLVIALVSLSVAVMGFLIFQAVRQEFHLRDLKTRVLETSGQVARKERDISELKSQIAEMKKSMDDGIKKMEELKKKREEIEKSSQNLAKTLQDCTTEKARLALGRTTGFSVSDSSAFLHAMRAKSKAQADIQSLKQQILDRDNAVCAFVDTTKEEAR
uniref:Si:dkey-87o1.2 n=1 Tax=Amphilophus citrinellus TaxID=61819 RepID=A0A3Q0S1R3_AMPCI